MRHLKSWDQKMFRKIGKSSSFRAAFRNHLQLQRCVNLPGNNEGNEKNELSAVIWPRIVRFMFSVKDRTLTKSGLIVAFLKGHLDQNVNSKDSSQPQ